MALTQRRFGVEIEHGNAVGNYAAVLIEMKKAKFPIEEGQRVLGGGPPKCYTGTADGTGVEIRTPALNGKAGLNELRKVMDFLYGIGGYTTAADGMHVHHEAHEFAGNGEAILALTDSWIANRPILHKFVAKHRHSSYSCSPVAKIVIENGIKQVAANRPGGFPRGDLNFGSLYRHGTVEIRLHEGTLNPDKATSWVVFGQAFIEKVLKDGQFGKQKHPRALLEHLEVTDEYAKVLYKTSGGRRVWR